MYRNLRFAVFFIAWSPLPQVKKNYYMLYRTNLLRGNKYLMYIIQWLADNKVCSCLYVLLWGNFICRMHLQACIKFHKINLPNYFLITVSSHLYTYPTSCHQLVYELLFISDVHTNSCCLICYTILLIPTSSPKLIVVPGTFSWLSLAPETSQVHRIWPHHYTVWTETAALQHASCSCSFIVKWAVVSVNHFALIEF